ncbi:hypothetical protein GALMADRAFT_148561 [Galerina marginata CBS 339.88]|uniref:Uncharacterized protein n=1 Tax=Galerina marginata (strain CBS 339.88) TaxID=685588 RepID=A0A067SCY9_GALM3|nr:hypothetical protein GALMADRAFT_148561 [Galerina marginata CBS 339.88]
MDQFYDIEATKTLLERIANERLPRRMQLQAFKTVEGIKQYCQISHDPIAKCWRLTEHVGDELEEAVLRFQGVLTTKTLPPIRSPFQIEPRQRVFFRQNVTITGLGTQASETAVQSIDDINEMFQRDLPQGSLEDWSPSLFDNYTAVDASNRYFTRRTDTSADQIIPFSNMVDPDGILDAAGGEHFVHTVDNRVEYYEMIQIGNEGISYNEINPLRFRIGDIVEAQVSFISVPMRDRRYKMLTVLRALTVLDMSPLRNAAIARNRYKNETITTTVVGTLKRKVGYSKDEVEETSEKIRRLHID